MNLCGFEVGLDKPLFVIAGPCVIESEDMAMRTAETLKEMTARLGINFIYKSSFDKANRSSAAGFRGPGKEEGLRILSKVKAEFDVPVITDVHEDTALDEVSEVVDVLQTPAFELRLQQPCVRHARPRHHARLQMPSGVRRNALGAAPRWAGRL